MTEAARGLLYRFGQMCDDGRRRRRADQGLRDGEAPLRRRRDVGHDRGRPDPRRLRLHQGVPGRALHARREDHPDLRGHAGGAAPRDRPRDAAREPRFPPRRRRLSTSTRDAFRGLTRHGCWLERYVAAWKSGDRDEIGDLVRRGRALPLPPAGTSRSSAPRRSSTPGSRIRTHRAASTRSTRCSPPTATPRWPSGRARTSTPSGSVAKVVRQRVPAPLRRRRSLLRVHGVVHEAPLTRPAFSVRLSGQKSTVRVGGLLASLLLALLAGGSVAAARDSAYPGRNGAILYIRDLGGNEPKGGHIFVTAPDGSGIRDLTPPGFTDVRSAAWSPDGRRIAFSATGTARPTQGVFVMNADGSGLRQVTRGHLAELSPTWSPDGKSLGVHELRPRPVPDLPLPARRDAAPVLSNQTTNCQNAEWSPTGAVHRLRVPARGRPCDHARRRVGRAAAHHGRAHDRQLPGVVARRTHDRVLARDVDVPGRPRRSRVCGASLALSAIERSRPTAAGSR